MDDEVHKTVFKYDLEDIVRALYECGGFRR
jgi:hypothetical protein